MLQQREDHEYFINVAAVIKQHYETKCVGRNLRSTSTRVKLVRKAAQARGRMGRAPAGPEGGHQPSGPSRSLRSDSLSSLQAHSRVECEDGS